MAQRSC
ncbi:unnamed protein product, partial [Adineta steineri]